jgi:hypothetical protein
MVPKMQKMPNRYSAVALLILLLLGSLVIAGGCGSATADNSNEEAGVLSAQAAKGALKRLPYRYEFRSVEVPAGASGAFGARVHGPHGTVVGIGVALGKEPRAVPVPAAGTSNAVGSPSAGFVFTNDILVPVGSKLIANKRLRTRAQWKAANAMATAMEEELCRAATGKPCPV